MTCCRVTVLFALPCYDKSAVTRALKPITSSTHVMLGIHLSRLSFADSGSFFLF